MSNFLEEYGLEMESDHFSAPMGRPTPPDPMLQPRKKGGALGKVLCLVLGFVLGVGGTVGGVAGAGYMVATQRIKDTIGTIGGLVGTEIKYQDFITEKYAEQTIMGAIREISKVAQKFSTGEGCLNDLNDISPLVSTSIEPLLKTLTDFGMDINKEDLMALPFSQFPDFFMEQLKEVELIALLGSAGVTDESPILNAICYDLDGNPTKLGIFFDEGPEGLLNNITLEAFLISADGVVDPAKDNLIMALAYGNANRYSLTEESKVVMNQKIYKRIGDTFYDIDGNEVTVGSEAGKHTVTEEEITYYLSETKATKGRARADEVKIYYAYEDIACTQASYYKKITLGNLIGGNASDLINGLELGSLFNISPLDENPDPITLALAYGEEGTHYVIKEVNGEKTIVWLVNPDAEEPGALYAPRTVGDMSKMGDIMDDLRLATVLKVNIADELTDKNRLSHALAFGYEGTDFTLDNEGNPTWIGDSYYRTVDSLSEMGPIMDTLRLATVLDIDPLDSKPDDKMTLAIAYGYEGTHYDIKEIDGEKTIVWREDPDADVPGTKYTYRTVKDMSNMGDIINDIRLETALGITADSPRLMVVLAYGSEGEGFEYVTDPVTGKNKIEVKEGCTPRTIADLNDPDVINGLTLNDMLGAEALEDDLLLSHLGNSNLNTLADDVSSLTFKQVYPEQIYKLKYFAVLGNVETELSSENNKFYNGSTEIPKEIVYAKYHYTMTKAPGDTVWTPANDWIKEDMIEYDPESKYYRHKETKVLLHFELTPQWKYLLVEPDQETHDYKLTEFTKLVDNMTKNMTNATLFDLSGDGIIELTDDTLNTEIMTELRIKNPLLPDTADPMVDITFDTPGLADTNDDDKLTLGDLTVTQMMDYTAEVIDKINKLNKLNK